MPKPVLKRRTTVGKNSEPTGMPSAKPEYPAAPTKSSVEETAKTAVAEYEQERKCLSDMLQEFETSYPDAAAALNDIKMQEEIVTSKISDAKGLVAQAKVSIGDFKCTIKFSKPKYDDEAFTKLVGELGDADTIIELIKSGVVKKVVLDSTATTWFAHHPTEAEAYQDAWRDKQELTPAITTPKM